MNLGDLIDGAKRAARDAFTPKDFAARPMYGVGYVPVSELGGLEDVVADLQDANRRAAEARESADRTWLLFAGAVVLAAVTDFVVVSHHLRRARKEKARGSAL